jgi:NADH-quinone oxidoreductase subunit J
MADILFIALAFFAITGAIAMLVYRSPMFSALGLLITMLSVAGMFALLNATLLFMVQIIVYAGAIMALILFILMFLNIKEEDLPKEPKKFMLIGFGAILMIPLNLLVLKAVSNLPSKDLYPIEGDFGTIKPVGLILYNEWIIAFELISILLLIALVGSVVLAKRRKTKITSKED